MESAAARLEQLAGSCAGPAGTLKLLVPGEPGCWASSELAVTSCSRRLMEHQRLLVAAQVDRPDARAVAHLLVELTRRQHEQCGDGGLLALHLAAALVRGTIEQQLPPQPASQGFATALGWLLAWLREDSPHGPLPHPVRPLSWSASADPLALVTTMLASKPLLATDHQSRAHAHLASITLRAFLASLNQEGSERAGTLRLSPNVRFSSAVGRGMEHSTALQDGLLLDLPVPPAAPTSNGSTRTRPYAAAEVWALPARRAVTVALFECSLQTPGSDICIEASATVPAAAAAAAESSPAARSPAPATPTPASAERSVCADGTSFHERAFSAKRGEVVLMEQLVDRLVSLRVGLVASQRLVHPWLRRTLAARGVVVLQRLSIKHIAAVQHLTGAQVLSDWLSSVLATGLGAACGLGLVKIASRVQLRLHAPTTAALEELTGQLPAGVAQQRVLDGVVRRRRAVATLLLYAPEAQAAAELKTTLEGAVSVLASGLAEPRCLLGAGRWQAAAVAHVRSLALREPTALPPGSPDARAALLFADCLELTARKRCGHAAWEQAARWLVHETDSGPDGNSMVADSFTATTHALQTAVECASSVIRLRTVVSEAQSPHW